ncbi:MAG: NnrS family protein [Pseudomonas sp.]|uniref:NnrS family protein n=1 Tax=Pseudomonas sp. TaxID=306 RepID=UPI00324232F4
MSHPVALFRLGFRPFFLAAAVFAVLAIPLWVTAWFGGLEWQPAGGWLAWHRHEMVFGFAAAVVVGFLLTAVQNWTGIAGLSGWPLAGLAALWLAARIGWLLGLPGWLLLPLDLAFLPVAALALGRRLVKVKQRRNYPTVLVLLLLSLCNLVALAGLLQGDHSLQRQGVLGAIWLIASLMTLIGGRVIPFFTRNGLGLTSAPEPLAWLDNALLVGSIVVALLVLSGAGLRPYPFQAFLFAALGAGHLLRLLRWHKPAIWRVPLLWSLQLSYLWMALACLMMAGWHAGWGVGFSQAVHLLVIGGVAGMILAMIARVTLGHTGRALQPPALISVAFAALNLAVPARVWLSIWSPQVGYWLAAALWALAFLLFVGCYGPMLLSPRVDGKPG